MAYAVNKDGQIVITLPKGEGKPSKSGKSMILDTTGGFADLGNGLKLSYNVIRAKQ